MPLTEEANFKAKIQKGNRLQIPRILRWKYKLETNEVLDVTIKLVGSWTLSESFLTKIGKEGRIVIPKLLIGLLKGDKPSIEGYAVEVTLGRNEKSSDDD